MRTENVRAYADGPGAGPGLLTRDLLVEASYDRHYTKDTDVTMSNLFIPLFFLSLFPFLFWFSFSFSSFLIR